MAIDVGGTFTDACVLDEATAELTTAKIPSSREKPLDSVIEAIRTVGVDLAIVRLITHSTTITTNALLTRTFPRAAMITTTGFRDIIEIRDGTQEDAWDSYREVSGPYIRRRDRYEVSERIDYSGRIFTPLDEEQALNIAEDLRGRGIRTVAVCFINSYANAEHERRMREILQAVDPGIHVSLSSEILPEINEYERFSTTVANALLASLVTTYVGRLADYLAANGYRGDLLLMHSGGGSMTAGLVNQFPLRLAASSIAGGAMAARHIAEQCGFQDAIAFDMGGTSTDITLINYGQVRVVKHWWVEYGHPISFPGVELATIGSGGGTIAWVDEAGALRNGPQSAGADPGPASYGRGGTHPTNTDANLHLGRLGNVLAGGKVHLNAEAAQRAIDTHVASPLAMDTATAAQSMVQVADAAMANAVRLLRQSRRSMSPNAPLIVFGGAGPMHGVAVARELQTPMVIVPPHPGITSALGCLLVDIRHDFSAMYQSLAHEVDPDHLEDQFIDLERQARDRLAFEGIADRDMLMERFVNMRYAGQWRSLTLPIGAGPSALPATVEEFQSEYQAQYSYLNKQVPVEIYQLSLTATGRLPKVQFREYEVTKSTPKARGHRPVVFDDSVDPVSTAIYDRSTLQAGASVHGPAIIEQIDTTTAVPPGYVAVVDEWLNLRITEES
jgi:N-methylhydantoinase A